MSTCEVLIGGRNFPLLFQRLKKHKIDVLNTRAQGEKKIIIEVKCKDLQKVFEISKNMWYNSVVCYHGPKRLWFALKKHAVIVLSALVFIASAYVLDLFVLDVDLAGTEKLYRTRVEKIVKSEGIGRFSTFSSVDTDGLKKKILSIPGVASAKIEKRGYTLAVTARGAVAEGKAPTATDKIYAKESGVIKSVTVFCGRALRSAGDTVSKGEVVADGVVTLNSGGSSLGVCRAIVAIEVSRVEEFTVADTSEKTIDDCVATARLFVFGESVENKVEIVPFGDAFIIKTTIFYTVVSGEE